jgi:hypothetical protein
LFLGHFNLGLDITGNSDVDNNVVTTTIQSVFSWI